MKKTKLLKMHVAARGYMSNSKQERHTIENNCNNAFKVLQSASVVVIEDISLF